MSRLINPTVPVDFCRILNRGRKLSPARKNSRHSCKAISRDGRGVRACHEDREHERQRFYYPADGMPVHVGDILPTNADWQPPVIEGSRSQAQWRK
jgi:hypothetical protein